MTPILALLTAVALFIASCIFLVQTVVEIKKNRNALLKSFNLLMTVFMLTWSVTELFEDTLQPPFSILWQYLHVVVMVSFAAAITWRWQWVASKTSPPAHGEQKSPSRWRKSRKLH